MAGISRSFKDGSGNPQNRSVTVAGGRDVSRWIPVDETDTFLDLGNLAIAANNYAAAANGYQASMDARLVTANTLLGSLTETPPSTDTGSSGISGRLQRMTQKLSSLIALLPAALGQGTMAQSLRVVLASDHSVIQVAQMATAAAGGVTASYYLASSAASLNAVNIKSSAGRVYSIHGVNKAAYDVFLCLYDTAGTPVPGTTTLKKKICLPAYQPFVLDFPVGYYFGSGISIATTKLGATGDTTVIASGDLVGLNVDYA